MRRSCAYSADIHRVCALLHTTGERGGGDVKGSLSVCVLQKSPVTSLQEEEETKKIQKKVEEGENKRHGE